MKYTGKATMRNNALCGGIRRLLVILIIMVAPLAIMTGAWAAPFAYVTNLGSGAVSAIDVATNAVIATISVERRPSWVAITPDGTRAYVTHDESNRVTVIDTNPSSSMFNTVVATVPSAPPSEGVAITPDGSRAYVTARFWGSVEVIDTDPHSATYNTVIASVGGLGYAPSGVAITPDGKRAYVTHKTYFQIDQVSVIDTDPSSSTYNTRIAIVGVGRLPSGVAVTPDGRRAYVANAYPFFNTSVSAIDTDPGSPTYNTVVASVPYGPWSSPTGVAITPNGTRAYVTLHGASSVSVIDSDPASATYNQVIATVGVGSGPFGVAITPDGTRAYVANFSSNAVSVIDTVNNTQFATVEVGSLPGGVAITPAPRVISVGIDIKPGSFPNSINPKSQGKIPVAILSGAGFDAPLQVYQTFLTFGRTGDEPSLVFCNSSPEDVNGDGLLDLVCHFHTLAAAFQTGDTEGILKGQTSVGAIPLSGTDSVRIVPPK